MKEEIIKLINAAISEVKVPSVSKQKQEFYKCGVRDLIDKLNIEIEKIKEDNQQLNKA